MKSTLFYLRVMNRKNWRGAGGHGAQATRSPQVQRPGHLRCSCWSPGGSTGGPAASDLEEEDLSLLLTEGHLLWDMVGGQQVQEGPGHLCPPPDAPADLHPLPHRAPCAASTRPCWTNSPRGSRGSWNPGHLCGACDGGGGSPPGIEGPTLALNRCFQRIHLHLREKKYSDCLGRCPSQNQETHLFILKWRNKERKILKKVESRNRT